MKIVAFLQNQWFRDPERIKQMLNRHESPELRQKLHRRLSHYALHHCHSGRRLRKALGEDRFAEIVWENVSPEIGGVSSSVFPPDPVHIRTVLRAEDPDIVLTFGVLANEALPPLWAGVILAAPHPAARGSSTVAELNTMAQRLTALLEIRKDRVHAPPTQSATRAPVSPPDHG